MARRKTQTLWIALGFVALGVFALPLLAGDDARNPVAPSTQAPSAVPPTVNARSAALAKLGAVLHSSKTTITQAIAKAEAASKGRAFGAELECRGGKVYYEVEIFRGGESPRVFDVLVDLHTGAVARMDDDDDWDDDGKSGKSEDSGKSGKSGHSGRSGKSDDSGKSGKSDDSDKSGKSDHSDLD